MGGQQGGIEMELILDIETVPAPESELQRFLELFPSKRKARDSPSLHPCTARIIAVGLKPVGGDPVVYLDLDERRVIENTKRYLEETRATKIITFNGSSFDFPMLRLRAAACGIRGFGRLLPASRSAKNCDLFHSLKWDMSLSLSELALLVLGELKSSGGNEIRTFYEAGDLDAIRAHNIQDLELIEKIYILREDLFGPGMV
jgi:predicted PolB exonuclease-like 3'-5' exonuclease